MSSFFVEVSPMSQEISFFTESECIQIEKVIIERLKNKEKDKEAACNTDDGSDVKFMIEYSWKNSL